MKWRRSVGVALLLLAIILVVYWVRPASRSPAELFEDGIAALERNELSQTQQIIDRLQVIQTPEPYGKVLNAGLQLKTGQTSEALQTLTPEVAVGRLREPVLAWAGECYFMKRDLAQAEILLRTASAEFPENHQVARLLAAVYFDLGAMHPALNQLMKLKAAGVKDYRLYHMSGAIYLDFEQFDNAVKDLEIALQLSQPGARRDEIALELAQGYRRLLKFDDAIRTAQSVRPSAAQCAELALAQLGKGDLSAATQSIERGRGFRTDEPNFLRAEAQVLVEKNEFDQAIVRLKRLAVLEPQDFEVHYKLAAIYQRQDRMSDHRAALAKFERLTEIRREVTKLNQEANEKPYDVELRLKLADLCREMGRLDLEGDWRRAAAACQKIIKQQPRPEP